MSNIEYLRRQIDSVSRIINSHEQPGGSSGSIAQELNVVSFRQHLEELEDKLDAELALRNKEIVEIALDDSGQPGTISLRLLAKIASHFGQAVHQAGRFRRYGTVRGPMPAEIEQTMDLRLADLTAASTHLFITGNASTDLFSHYSLVEESLHHTFEVLNADTAEALTNAVAEVGYSATSALKKFLKEVARDEHTLAIRWQTPEEKEEVWEGDPDKMRRLASSLEAFSKIEPEEVEVEGSVITVSLREPFAIEADNGQTYEAFVAFLAIPLIQDITVGTRVRARLLRNVMRNKATGREKVTLTLLGLTRV